MIDEKKTDEKVVQEVVRGDRGIVGVASTSDMLKQQWHAAGAISSLKRWAKTQAKNGNQTAEEWLKNKVAPKREERSDKNKARISLEKTASKAARKSKKKPEKPVAAWYMKEYDIQ